MTSIFSGFASLQAGVPTSSGVMMAPTSAPDGAWGSEENIWSRNTQYYSIVEAVVKQKQLESFRDLQNATKALMPRLKTLLKNPPRNSTQREKMIKDATEQSSPFDKRFVNEAVILSDLFNMNEVAAAGLLQAAESQQPDFPGLTRGLVAVVLYYDSQRKLLWALRTLMQARPGRCWTLNLPPEVTSYVQQVTEELVASGIVGQLLDLVCAFDWIAEAEKLSSERGLGHPKHRKQVRDIYFDSGLALTEIVFCLAAQTGLNLEDSKRLLAYFRERDVVASSADASLGGMSLTLLMASLYAVDVSVLETCEDSDDILQRLPMTSDVEYMKQIHGQLYPPTTLTALNWKSVGALGTIQLAWGLALRQLSNRGGLHQSSTTLNIGGAPAPMPATDVLEQDEAVVEQGLANGALEFLRDAVLKSSAFYGDEFFQRVVHRLLTDFIVQMPTKLKELRNRADENARILLMCLQEGREPPAAIANSGKDFQAFLQLIGEFYSQDPLGLELCLEFWCPSQGSDMNLSSSFSSFLVPSGLNTSHHSRLTVGGGGGGGVVTPPQRQVSLHKFVRSSGELLYPSIFVPYIRMLRGLANSPNAAKFVNNMLKSNCATNVHSLKGSSSHNGSSVSWDHFFASLNQYFMALRHEAATAAAGARSAAAAAAGGGVAGNISNQELEGLLAVLKLIETIVRHDESTRLALAEDSQYSATVLILGLAGCSVPPDLKAALFDVLRAFAITPEVAVNLWHALESSQVFQTSRKTGRVCDVEMELAEIESRNEEYPITLAFVDLLDKLTDVPVPAALGAGVRVPGFTPHLEYLINEVLLKFDLRAYKDSAQEWLVARGALKILSKLLGRYRVAPEHFADQTVELQGLGAVESAKPPGFLLMVHLLTDGALLKKLLLILHELTNLMLTYPVATPEAEKDSSLYILRILAVTLEKQQMFLDMIRETASPLLLSKLDSLLLAINPRTGANDHLTTIATFVTFNMALPEHALLSVEIVKSIARAPAMQKELLSLLTSFKLSADILHGFVECLEAEETEDATEAEAVADAESSQRIAARQGILQLILDSLLEHPAPNFAHFLLGFDTKKPINKTELQDAGVLGAPLTCLHAIVALLNRGLAPSTTVASSSIGAKGKIMMHKSARVAYHVIYVLCSNAATCGPAMRYLRSSADFVFTQAQHLPTTAAAGVVVPRVSLLSQLSWLLKTTAIELRLTSINKQRSHVQRLIQLFLSSSPTGGTLLPSERDDGETTLLATESFARSHLALQPDVVVGGGGGGGNQLRPKLLQILDAIDFSLEIPEGPDLNMFDLGALETVIKSCQVQLESGLVLCDVKSLHEILLNEVNAGFAQLPSQTVVDGKSGGAGYPQPPRQQIKSEIQALLDHVVAQNQAKEYLHSQQQAFEAWRQVTEILLTACSLETHGIQGQSKNSIILLVLQHLTAKILDSKSAPELVSPAAGVILTLVSSLRQSIMEAVAALSFNAATSKPGAGRDERTMLDRTSVRNPLALGGGGLSQGLFSNLGISVSQLLVVLKGLIQTVLKPGGTLPNERANLYGALLNYLHIADVPAAMAKQGASAMDIEKLCMENANAINSYGDHFLEMVARDACDAHHVAKMLALSLLDAMVAIDKQNVIVHFLANKGYLQHLVDSLLQEDPLLQTLLIPNHAAKSSAAASKALYIYEAKLALLIRMATVSTPGATSVLHSAILDRLACCKFLDMRPDSTPLQDDSATQEVANFRALLFPALKLSLALLTALGRQVACKLMLMISAHAETFHAILRERHASWDIVHVNEMNLVTAVLAKSSIYASEGTFIGDETLTPEFLSQLGWIERQMLTLLPRFFLSAQLQSNLPENLGGTSQLHLGVLKVASNVLSYCSSIAHSGGAVPRLVFAPTFNESAGDLSSTYVNRGKNPSLALPLLHLQTYASLFLSTSDHLQRLQRKREAVQDLRADELQELSSSAALSADEKIPAGRRQQVVAKRLDDIIETVEEQRSLLLSVMENLVFLLWRHLDVYLMRCSPVDVDSSVYLPRQQFPLRPPTTMTSIKDANAMPESQTNLTVNELNALKAEVAASLGNDGLFRKLYEIEQIHAKSNNRFSFLLAMVRRLKRFQKLHTDTNIC